ncbi:MAG TPA: fused MFS/spermidine synthase [Caldilineaceae bacterium]|nr:fused MFS/spermidine synthase [Caldilineaceae bacterium]
MSAYAALMARLAPVRALPDGALLTEPVGPHFHVITKQESALRFWLVEQTNPTTGVIQSEIDLDEPLALQEAYTQAMLLALLWQPVPQRVYVAGLGGGRLPLLLHHYCATTVLDCTEIEPEIVQIAERYFGLQQDERLRVAIEDGRRWLERNDTLYDLILVDAFLDNGYSPYRMSTVEFYRLCQERLTPGGALSINLLANDPFIERKVQGLTTVFTGVWLAPTRPVDGDENVIAIASDRADLDRDALTALAQQVDALYGFPFALAGYVSLMTRLQPAALSPLRDDEPPEEYFASLPSFNSPFSRVAPDRPCPCGSGQRFANCHGLNA